MCNIASDTANTVKALRMLSYHKGWKLSTTGKSKLFIQINDQKIISEFIDYSSSLTGCTDALLALVGDLKLEGYITSMKNAYAAKR